MSELRADRSVGSRYVTVGRVPLNPSVEVAFPEHSPAPHCDRSEISARDELLYCGAAYAAKILLRGWIVHECRGR